MTPAQPVKLTAEVIDAVMAEVNADVGDLHPAALATNAILLKHCETAQERVERLAANNELEAACLALDIAQAALHRIHDRAGLEGNASLVTITEHALRNESWDDTVLPGRWVCVIDGTPVESEPCPYHGHTGAPWCCDTCRTAAVLDAEIVEADDA